MPKSKSKSKGGLLEALLDGSTRKPLQKQNGGASKREPGDSYAWHRAKSASGVANARSNLSAKKQLAWETESLSGEDKRAAWVKEVREVMKKDGINYRDALKEASRLRKASNKKSYRKNDQSLSWKYRIYSL